MSTSTCTRNEIELYMSQITSNRIIRECMHEDFISPIVKFDTRQ